MPDRNEHNVKRTANGNEMLAECLRREAFASRPEFSAALHERLCEAIRRRAEVTEGVGGRFPYRDIADAVNSSSSPATRKTTTDPFLGRWAVAVAAAVCLLALSAVWWWGVFRPAMPTAPGDGLMVRDVPHQPPLEAPAPLPAAALVPDSIDELTEQAAEGLDQLFAAVMETHKWAELDHQVGLAFQGLGDTFPINLTLALASSDSEPGQTEGAER